MNKIILKGVLRNIEFSHFIGDIEYNKACLITKDGDVIDLKFKKFSNKYKDGDEVELVGNVRSYSHKTEDGKNKVDLYVFTYFDLPESGVFEEESCNKFILDGRICKIDKLREDRDGKQSLHFILANNIVLEGKDKTINNYLPCVCFGSVAPALSDLKVGDKIGETCGYLRSREYKKRLDNGEFEIRVAHELCIDSAEKVKIE